MARSGIAVGPNHGHKTNQRELKAKPSNLKGRLSKHMKFVRSIVREVCGYAPYEKRCLELLKIGREKRCLKVLRKKLGSIRRAKAKREDLQTFLRQQRMK
eukprot:c12124_g1_i1.p1 GENE.c12124_g1_i1~~c12124_g1_i1.p1  ORF type:complete len:100 (+),score=17.44 c12124_g1_i1:51-350(+)